ncbi:amidohydrolase family protein, partial [Pseudomonas sp. CrR25]|nr:amidohydrolase family protein [Pseudomonas sp. CrR25]
PASLLQFMQSYGQDKVLFGSNFPQLALSRCMSQVEEVGLSAQVQAKFLHENARRVFKL